MSRFTLRLHRPHVILAFAGAIAVASSLSVRAVAAPDPALTEFAARLGDYVTLRERVRMALPPVAAQAMTNNQTANDRGRVELGDRIRAARADAGPGDVFTIPVARLLRARLQGELRGEGAASGTRASIRDDRPLAFALRVNARYPPGASLPTMPGNVLAVLPVLPPGLEYRIVQSHLLLRDSDANLIVDYLLDIMCRAC